MRNTSIRLFRKAVRAFEQAMVAQLNTCCSGVSQAQCHALIAIEEHGKLTIGQLAQNLDLDNSTLSRTVQGLVEVGFVERTVHPTDRRAVLLSLTEKGRATCHVFNEASDRYYTAVLEQIPPEERGTVVDKFSLLVEAFVRHEHQSRRCDHEDK